MPYASYIVKALECREKAENLNEPFESHCERCHYGKRVMTEGKDFKVGYLCNKKELMKDAVNLILYQKDRISELQGG